MGKKLQKTGKNRSFSVPPHVPASAVPEPVVRSGRAVQTWKAVIVRILPVLKFLKSVHNYGSYS